MTSTKPGAQSHPGSMKVGLIRQLTLGRHLALDGDIPLAHGDNHRLDAGRDATFALGAFDELMGSAFANEQDLADFPIGLAERSPIECVALTLCQQNA